MVVGVWVGGGRRPRVNRICPMSYRRKQNRREWWLRVVGENRALLQHLPAQALVSEASFRDYLTRGVHGGVRLSPELSGLPAVVLQDLWVFVQHKACFDMDVTLFDEFNKAYRQRGTSAP